jgi:hypothetical protein
MSTFERLRLLQALSALLLVLDLPAAAGSLARLGFVTAETAKQT